MRSDTLLLFKTLSLASGLYNKQKYEKDKKKRRRIRSGYIGMGILYLMLVLFCFVIALGFGFIELWYFTPLVGSIIISLIVFFTTLFKANGYLFGLKDYDMLMALPFSTKTVVASKFIYMYSRCVPWILTVTISCLIGCEMMQKVPLISAIYWILLSFFLPILPMVLAALIGTVAAKISSMFKAKNLLQTILTFIFITLCFCSRFFFDRLFRPDTRKQTVEGLKATLEGTSTVLFTTGLYQNAIVEKKLSSALLLIGSSILIAEAFFFVVSRYYKSINSKLSSNTVKRNYRVYGMKERSVLNTIAFKELRRMIGSTPYVTNAAFGELFISVLSIVVLFIDVDKIISVLFQGLPINKSILIPIIPIIIHFMVGMVSTTALSYSLEGKNYWIMQSLPITKETIHKGKMLFNLYLMVPASVIGNLCFSISCKSGFVNTLLSILLGISFCIFSTLWGSRCNLKHLNLDWENEIEVIKQGAALLFYLFPVMFGNMFLIAVVILLGRFIPAYILLTALIVFILALSVLISLTLKRLVRKVL